MAAISWLTLFASLCFRDLNIDKSIVEEDFARVSHRIFQRKPFVIRQLILAGAGLLAMAAGKVQAVTIDIGLGDPGKLLSEKTVAFSALNGTSLDGQSLPLDFIFSADEFVRVFTITTSYAVLVTLQTNGSGVVGFLHGTGHLLDQYGHGLCTPQTLGSASSSDASMAAGLFPLFSGEFTHPFDHYGVHYALELPVNSPISITGGEVRLYTYDGNGPFGIGPGLPIDIVPDTGGTLFFLGIGLMGLMAVRRRASAAA